jgi:hypothetical protein
MIKYFEKTVNLLILTILLIFSANKISGQNNPYVDERALHFGFFIGGNIFDFGVQPSFQEINGEKFAVADATLKPGFTVGLVSDFRLGNYWNVRINPLLQFAERELTYKSLITNEVSKQSILSVPIGLPVYLKYSSERYGNYRPYLIGGVGIYYDLARDREKPVLLRPIDFYIEFGVGCDIYFSFFKLAPELKFALGFNDMLTPFNERTAGFIGDQDRKYTDALTRLTSRMLTLAFNFE